MASGSGGKTTVGERWALCMRVMRGSPELLAAWRSSERLIGGEVVLQAVAAMATGGWGSRIPIGPHP
jgi:hypothetical protein